MSGYPALGGAVGPAPEGRFGTLNELTLLQSFAEAHLRYDAELFRVRTAAIAGEAIIETTLIELQAERDALFDLWKRSWRPRRPALDLKR